MTQCMKNLQMSGFKARLEKSSRRVNGLLSALLKGYQKLSLPARAAVWFGISQFLHRGISMLTTPFFTRLLPAEEYGLASTFVSWENILLILIAGSSYKGVLNLCARYNDRDKMLTGIMGYNITFSFLWALLFLLFNRWLKEITGFGNLLLVCLLLYCIFQNVISCWSIRMQYDYKYKESVTAAVVCTAFSSFAGLLSVVFISASAEAKIIPQVVISLMVGIVLMLTVFQKGGTYYDKETWKFLFCFCIPLMPHYLSEIVLQSSDRIMINHLCGASDVAIYSVAYSVGNLISMVTAAVNAAFAPYQFQRIKSQEYEVLARNTNRIMLFVAFCLCGIMMFGREIVLIFGGETYTDSVRLIMPICLGAFFNYVFQLFARVQEYFEQKHTIIFASMMCAVLNVILNSIFIAKYGYSAAAYTTFFCYFVFCFLHYLFYRMACRRHIKREIYDSRGLAVISALLLAAAMVIYFMAEFYVIKYVLTGVVCAVGFWKREWIVDAFAVFRKRL